MQPSQQYITNNINYNIQQSQDVQHQIQSIFDTNNMNQSQNQQVKRSQPQFAKKSQSIDSFLNKSKNKRLVKQEEKEGIKSLDKDEDAENKTPLDEMNGSFLNISDDELYDSIQVKNDQKEFKMPELPKRNLLSQIELKTEKKPKMTDREKIDNAWN